MVDEVFKAPELLVSVRNADEAKAALDGGTDWLDLKEPLAGPLAAVDMRSAKAVVEAVSGNRPVSAALGELRDWEGSTACELLSVPGVSVVKLGLAGCGQLSDWQGRWLDLFHLSTSHKKRLAAVIYADWQRAGAPMAAEVIACARECQCQYLLIDTFEKDGRSTFDFLSDDQLREILLTAKGLGMTTVMAGSLTSGLLERVCTHLVDVVAVRGAVCRGGRTGSLETKLVQETRRALGSYYVPTSIIKSEKLSC